MGILFSNIKVKWTRYSAQKLFLSRCFSFVCGYLPYIMQFKIYILQIYIQKTIWNIYSFSFASQAKWKFYFKNDFDWYLVLFSLRLQVILLQCLQNHYNLTQLYCLFNILPSIEAAPKLANLYFVLTKYIFNLVI